MSDEGVIFHFRQDLLQALVNAIALLNKSKPDVITFFQGAGVPRSTMASEIQQLRTAPKETNKYAIARAVLTRLNEQGDKPEAIRQRREVAKRVAKWDNFSTCWEDDRLKAKGAIEEVRNLIHIRSGTRPLDPIRPLQGFASCHLVPDKRAGTIVPTASA